MSSIPYTYLLCKAHTNHVVLDSDVAFGDFYGSPDGFRSYMNSYHFIEGNGRWANSIAQHPQINNENGAIYRIEHLVFGHPDCYIKER